MAVSKFYLTPLTPPYLNFAITKAVVNSFVDNLHAGKGAVDMKHIKQNFSLKAWVHSPGWT